GRRGAGRRGVKKVRGNSTMTNLGMPPSARGVFQMLRPRSWLVPALIVGAARALVRYRRGMGHPGPDPHRHSAPPLHVYDPFAAVVLNGFFSRVAHDFAELSPGAQVLEVGSGPGRLAARLAELAPYVRVTGIDITPEMVEKANALAARTDVADRVEFRIG